MRGAARTTPWPTATSPSWWTRRWHGCPALYRDVLVLRELEGRSYDEMGEILGCRLGAVKSRLHRARMSFVALIAPHLD